MSHRSGTFIVLCSLTVGLALLVFATNTRKDSYLHHQQLDQDQSSYNHYHHHEPTLAGAIFPVASEILAGKKYIKEPCPTGCIHHRSNIYLAVTSVGDGFPRVQFTCSHGYPTRPIAATATARQSEGNYYGQPYKHNNIQRPPDPIPEPTPELPSHGCEKCSRHESHDSTDGASSYTDLYITENPGSSPMSHYDGHIQEQFHYGVIFSPHERQSTDLDNNGEYHTTTMTFSDHNNANDEHIHMAAFARRELPLTVKQEMLHRRDQILSADDRLRASPTKSLFKSESAGSRSELTTPESIATLIAPTPTSGAGRDQKEYDWYEEWSISEEESAPRKAALHIHENETGPADPTPEPLPYQTKGYSHINDNSDSQDQEESDTKNKSKFRYRTVIHRVTTLIIETETIVNRPTPTIARRVDSKYESMGDHGDDYQKTHQKGKHDQKQHRRNSYAYGPHVGDHIMFDAGEDGDMVVSIALSEQSSRRNKVVGH
ncbi:hypothetical protein FBU30_007430 [Linnemannia zychae]|nr:hypothetical protein FBU30_007430 [Linnemannia zychae]